MTAYPARVRVWGGRVVHALSAGTRGSVGVPGRGGRSEWVATVTAETACGRHLDLGPSGRSERDGTLLNDDTVVTCKACSRRVGES